MVCVCGWYLGLVGGFVGLWFVVLSWISGLCVVSGLVDGCWCYCCGSIPASVGIMAGLLFCD